MTNLNCVTRNLICNLQIFSPSAHFNKYVLIELFYRSPEQLARRVAPHEFAPELDLLPHFDLLHAPENNHTLTIMKFLE